MANARGDGKANAKVPDAPPAPPGGAAAVPAAPGAGGGEGQPPPAAIGAVPVDYVSENTAALREMAAAARVQQDLFRWLIKRQPLSR